MNGRISTGFMDIKGVPIHTFDTIEDEHGNRVMVFEYNRRFRVALQQSDLSNGQSASLGLFIIGGVKIVEADGAKNVPH